ncbi:Ras family protein [Ancylostoma caninum]|uniref:Ras family protein n=1 Tax=Ancylostoma caninum TaxID=29170 RepID=A0A368FI53_ANCCA|nr:Ras family protein [Ancylostoma caninum]
MKFPVLFNARKEKPIQMSNLTDVDLVRCVVIGDSACGKEMMLKKYAAFSGVPFDSALHLKTSGYFQNGQLITAFNGRKCIFVDSAADQGFEDPHVFLLCVSVARQASVEETVRMILDTVIDRIRAVPFVLVGTQIEKRLLTRIEYSDQHGTNYTPMPLHRAESFAKRIGASKYLECSEITGVSQRNALIARA